VIVTIYSDGTEILSLTLFGPFSTVSVISARIVLGRQLANQGRSETRLQRFEKNHSTHFTQASSASKGTTDAFLCC